MEKIKATFEFSSRLHFALNSLSAWLATMSIGIWRSSSRINNTGDQHPLDTMTSSSNNTPKMLTDFSIDTIIGSSTTSKYQDTSTDNIVQLSPSSDFYQDAKQNFDNQQVHQRKFRPKNFPCPACQMAFSNNGQLTSLTQVRKSPSPSLSLSLPLSLCCWIAEYNETWSQTNEIPTTLCWQVATTNDGSSQAFMGRKVNIW